MDTQDPGDVWTITLQPVSGRFDDRDDRWRDQVAQFYVDLDRQVGGVERSVEPVDGTKGGIETIVLALGSAGVFSAAVEFFRAWLGRDRSRRLSIAWNDGGQENHVTLTGDALDNETLHHIAAAAAARIGGAPDPGSPTPVAEG